MTSTDPMLAGRDPRTRAFGSSVVLAHLDALASRLERAAALDDPEDVHQLRVTSRRLRADLPVLKGCYDRTSLEAWKGSLKMLTNSLGQARDADVQIMFLEHLLGTEVGRDMGSGLGWLLEERRSYRASIQPDVAQTIGRFLASGTLEGMRSESLENLSRTIHKDDIYRSTALRLTARRHIARRLKDLLFLEGCIGSETAAAEHHRLRIAAKKLRYTLELFAPLFRGRLKGAVGAFKHLQDLLGDIHDCDVWSDKVQSVLGGSESERAPDAGQREDLQAFHGYVVERRHSLYGALVQFWRGRKMGRVLKTLDERFVRSLHLPGQTYGTIGVISDVHGNLEALEAVMADGRSRGVKLWVSAGDLVGLGPCPDEVVRAFRDRGVLTISGNYDREVLMTQPSRWKGVKEPGKVSKRFTRTVLSRSSLKYLSSLEGRLELLVGRTRVHLFHGTPASDDGRLDPQKDRELIKGYLKEGSVDVMISGHTHEGISLKVGSGRYLNPGSVGRAGDGDPRASYATLDISPIRAEVHRVEYDWASTAQTSRERGLPEVFAQQFISGRSIDHLLKEEAALRDMGHLTRFEIVRDISLGYLGSDHHTENVLELALQLFDGTKALHDMGEQQRFILSCSALLHDIGWTETGPDHHKRSMEMVLCDRSLPLTSDERAIVANIVRYHNSMPKPRHTTFRYLSNEDKATVLWMSSLLRIADSLDASHSSLVRALEVLSGPKLVVLRCAPEGDMDEELMKLELKKDLFEKVSGRKLKVELVTNRGC